MEILSRSASTKFCPTYSGQILLVLRQKQCGMRKKGTYARGRTGMNIISNLHSIYFKIYIIYTIIYFIIILIPNALFPSCPLSHNLSLTLNTSLIDQHPSTSTLPLPACSDLHSTNLLIFNPHAASPLDLES